MELGTLTDVTPAGVATAIGAVGQKATWIQFTAPASNSGDIRFGDSLVSATRGVRIPKGLNVLASRLSFDQGQYELSKVYVFGTGSDSVSITFGI